MKKRIIKGSLIGLVALTSLLSCQGNDTPSEKPEEIIPIDQIDKDNIAFTEDDIINDKFGGIGVEWGAYEDTDKLIDGGWEKIIDHMDHFGAARIRLMINYDWFCQNFDDKGNNDHSDDTWTYNFTNKYALNMLEILDYSQKNGIDVAFGAWNVIGQLNNDVWGMMEEVTSDIRWAKITADVLNFLVNEKGYSCIKWFVNSNEPNLTGAKGSSKNYNNTYEIWEQGVKNVRKALDDIGLTKIGIIGGDTTGYRGCDEYFSNIANRIPGYVADYGAHFYLSNIEVDRGIALNNLRELAKNVKKIHPEFGKGRPFEVWESGFIDGKTALDSQTAIATTSYAIRMADFTIQCLASGMDGICYWDFDDAMHFMYTSSATYPKEWGMFSSLAEASADKQELRPWYHSSSLLTHLFKKGNKIYSPIQNNTELDNSFRSIATISQDGKKGGFAAVNASLKTVTKTFYLDDEVSGDKLYIYNFNNDSYLLGSDGYTVPNYVIDGSLNKKLELQFAPNTVIVVSNTELK